MVADSSFVVESVAVDIDDHCSKMVGPVTDPSMLSPVSCLSISGKRTAQNFQMANAKGQKAQMLGHNQAISIIDDQYRNDPMPLKARLVREQLRIIDGRNAVGGWSGIGMSAPREGLAKEYNLTLSQFGHRRSLTATLESKYGKAAGKGSLMHPHAYDHGVMVETIGQHTLKGGPNTNRGGGKSTARGLQSEVLNLARMHAAEIEKERKEREQTIDMEEALIRRSMHREAAASKSKGAKGSSCFKSVPREKSMAGNRMTPPQINFGPGHYNISYEATDRHLESKDIKAGFISGGRHFLSLRLIGQQDGQQAEQSAADLQGGKGEEEEEDGLHVREGHPASPGKGSARGSRGKPTETDSGPEAPPLTSSFKNTGMDKPSVQRAKPQNGGAHLGPAKYLVNYKPVTPAPKSVADFQRQLSRPLFCEDDGRPGPGYYEPPPTGRTGCSRRGQRYPGTRAFDKQKGRDPFSKVHDTRPATAPVVMHTSSPLPFSPPALQEPFAPIRAIQAMRESRAGQITRMTERVGRPATVDSTRQHEMILAAWQAKHGADQQRPGTVPGSFADAGMGMWFDEYGHPLTSAVAVGWAPDQVPQEEVAWHKTRYGAAVSGQEVNTESWATGGLRTAPKLGTMPRCSRTAELQGQRILCSSKSGFPLTAPRCNQPDTRTDLNPKHDLVMAKAPSWSLPKNRTEKPKRWVPPKNLIEAHMD